MDMGFDLLAPRFIRMCGLVCCCLVLGPLTLSAQVGLMVFHKGTGHIVRKVENGVCHIELEGRLIPMARKARTALVGMNEYLPYLVSVKDMNARLETTEMRIAYGESMTSGNHFRFVVSLESEYRLENVFLLLDIKREGSSRVLFYHGVGTLEPRRPQLVLADVPHPSLRGEARYDLHLYSDGGELLHSGQPVEYREAQLAKIVMRRLEGVRDAEARPLVGPEPAFPETLRSQGVQGEAVVRMKISRSGAVVDPVVTGATAPEFGNSALACVRQWRFLPRMRDGEPVEAEVEMPFRFDPQAPDWK